MTHKNLPTSLTKISEQAKKYAHRVGQLAFWKKVIIILVLLTSAYAAVFWTKPILFSYTGVTCAARVTLLPDLFKTEKSSSYSVSLEDPVKIGNFSLMSRAVCINAEKMPIEGRQSASYSFLGSMLFRQGYDITTPTLAKITTAELKNVAVSKPLELALSQSDYIFSYQLKANNKTATCTPEQSRLRCDIKQLELKQGAEYALSLERTFKGGKKDTLLDQTVKTLSPTIVTDTSIKQGEQVFAKPTDIIIKTDKKLKKALVKLERLQAEVSTEVAQSLVITEEGVQITLAAPLERSSDYRLTLSEVEATDGSTLLENYALPFRTSGGPKVTGVNAPTSGVAVNATIVVTFDQPLLDSQDVRSRVEFAGGQATVTKAGNQVIIKFVQVPTCGDFSISITKDMQSNFGIAGDSAWKFSSRTICHTVSTIGYSVNGRPIKAYYFGNGGTKILFTGAIHGSEKSSKYILDRWINELETKARSIPADKQIVIIPIVNPDGFATGTRYNARNVNLNRNFPTSNWTADIPIAGGRTEPGAGGSAALSEAESRVLAQFTNRLGPSLTVTYHSQGSIVNSNDAGSSITLGRQYAQLTGYQYISNANTNATFDLEMTGTYEDWLLEQGRSAILIELPGHGGDYFTANRKAMWAMLGV